MTPYRTSPAVLIFLTFFCFACGSLPEDETGEQDNSPNVSSTADEMNTNNDSGEVAEPDGMGGEETLSDMPNAAGDEEEVVVVTDDDDDDDDVVVEPSGAGGEDDGTVGAGGVGGDEDTIVGAGGTAGNDVVSGAGGDDGEDDMMANGGNEGDMDMEPEGCVVPQGSNSLQAEIQDVINRTCANCHGSTFPQGLSDITSAICRSSRQVSSMNLIEPGDAQNSYLYHKVAGSHTSVGGSGRQMPLGGSWTLDEVDRLAEYIDSLGN